MPIANHLNQTITLYRKSSKNKYGEESFGAAATHKARFQERYKLIDLPNGEKIETDASVWLLPSVAIDKEDKISYRSKDWEVVQVYNRQGRTSIDHIQVILRKL